MLSAIYSVIPGGGNVMALVLCTGVDRVLLRTRALILEQAGHHVVSAGNEAEVIAACKQHRFDVAVLGQGMGGTQKQQILRVVRESCPDARVLELFQRTKSLPQADAWLEVPADVPADLAQKVAKLAAL
jgi:CheY-like chemotaxis protein